MAKPTDTIPCAAEKQYVGQRPADDHIGDCRVFVVIGDQVEPLHHVVHHSPTGFEWGYGGSGPADLALSILADYFNERPTPEQLYHGHCRCWQLHQPFKRAFVAGADSKGFTITSAQIAEWLKTQGVEP